MKRTLKTLEKVDYYISEFIAGNDRKVISVSVVEKGKSLGLVQIELRSSDLNIKIFKDIEDENPKLLDSNRFDYENFS